MQAAISAIIARLLAQFLMKQNILKHKHWQGLQDQAKLSCDSDYVIYLGTCTKCQGQYVGKSQNIFKKRHSNHKQEVKKIVGGLGHYYGGDGGCGYQNISMTIIEQVQVKTPDFLAERELYWQHQLRAYLENGGNAHCRKKEFK